MILKYYELNKINLGKNNFFLFYGKNEGLKDEVTKTLVKGKETLLKYDEKEVLENTNEFIDNILTKSLFESEKIIIIKRGTDKLLKILDKIFSSKISNVKIIIDSENLEKKSKLRSIFEKNPSFICSAFYPDNEQTLSKLAYSFFKEKKIALSQANINLIVSMSNGDRKTLFNELEKIEIFSKNKKPLTTENLLKLINLIENHNISILIDYCLAKNRSKAIKMLNENNLNNEDCILIIKTLLNKAKRILKLSKEFEMNKNIDLTISSAKPPIFWKDKEVVKQQIFNWKPKKITQLIFKLNEIELIAKKNINNSMNLTKDFILSETLNIANN